MDIHGKSVDMDGKFHIHGKTALLPLLHESRENNALLCCIDLDTKLPPSLYQLTLFLFIILLNIVNAYILGSL